MGLAVNHVAAALLADWEAALPSRVRMEARAQWPKVLRFVKLLHDSGVKLMIGTDGTGGGPIYARELYDMTEAGIPAWEVLRMATLTSSCWWGSWSS